MTGSRARFPWLVLASMIPGAMFALGACGPQGAYSRGRDAGEDMGASVGGTGVGGAGGVNINTGGAGGMLVASGGSGGGTGGRGAGGAGTGGAGMGAGGSGTGGRAAGGTGTGGATNGGAAGGGTGGAGTGGAGVGTGGAGVSTGGAGTGGASVGTGGAATGGAGTGGAGTGGAGTGGAGTGGAGTGGAATGGAGPRILSIDFVGGSQVSTGGAGGSVLMPATAMASTELAGFRSASNWNSAAGNMGSLAALATADGLPTAATVTWNSPSMGTNPGIWRIGYLDAPGSTRMMNGYLDPAQASAPATVVVSALPTTITMGGYDVYVYVGGNLQSGQIRTYRYAIASATIIVTETGPSPTTFPGFTLAPAGGAGNYVVFRNVTGASFTLTATPGTGTPTRAPVNGLQIVSPSGS